MDERKPPPRSIPATDNAYLDLLTKGVFLAGFRWSVVDGKWPGFQAAFDGFDIDTVAAYGPPDVDRLAADKSLVRNVRKIEATVHNAGVLRDLIGEHGSVKAWLDTTADLPWPDRKKAVARPFRFVGDFGAYFFLWSVGEAVPPHEEQESWSGPVPPGSPESLG